MAVKGGKRRTFFRKKYKRVDPLDRLWSKISPEPMSGCWLWTGACDPNGYGRFGFKEMGIQLAHRAAWVLLIGPISDDLFILHKCDTPSCVNPCHLFTGSQEDNMIDRSKKGRAPRGMDHWKASITEEMIFAIRSRYIPGNGRALGREFGITQCAISNIVNSKKRFSRYPQTINQNMVGV